MESATSERRFRIWIARYEDWRPRGWSDQPPRAVALELAEIEAMASEQAAEYLQGFNEEMRGRRKRLWAVAIAVDLMFRNEPQPGDLIATR